MPTPETWPLIRGGRTAAGDCWGFTVADPGAVRSQGNRARPGGTAERMKTFAAQIHDRLAAALDVPEPKVRIRILLIDDDHALGVN